MAKTKLPYYPMYPADFDGDENVREMSDEELGFYIRCLNHQWINGSIPADLERLARIMRTTRETATRLWAQVGKCFRPDAEREGRLINPRLESERFEAHEKSDKARVNVGRRWAKERASQSDPSEPSNLALELEPQATEPQERAPEPEAPKETKRPAEIQPSMLPMGDAERVAEKIHGAHPNRERAGSLREVSHIVGRLIASAVDPAATARAIEEHHAARCKTPSWTKDNGEYAPGLAKWLKSGKWTEPVEEEQPPKKDEKKPLDWRQLRGKVRGEGND